MQLMHGIGELQMSSNYNDTENYCKDCDRSIYGKYPSCDINIENDGRYVKAGSPCYCKVNSTVGGMVEKYPWENRKLKKCPFCGGEARLLRYARKKYGKDEYIIGTAVCCGVCDARIFFRSETLAIEAWNRRVKDD